MNEHHNGLLTGDALKSISIYSWQERLIVGFDKCEFMPAFPSQCLATWGAESSSVPPTCIAKLK